MTVKEVLAMKEKLPVVDLHVRFIRAYEKKTGTGEYGDWSIQNFDVADDTGTITVAAFNRPEDFAQLGWEEKPILISAVKTSKGWTGASTFDDTYNNTTTRKIRLTKLGICTIDQHPAVSDQRPADSEKKPTKLSIDRAAEIIQFCHRLAQTLYPDAPDAAATVGNTLFIAIANGKISTEEENL